MINCHREGKNWSQINIHKYLGQKSWSKKVKPKKRLAKNNLVLKAHLSKKLLVEKNSVKIWETG